MVGCVARATAANKLRIVEGLQRTGKVVAMTGDGVNDAPAVRAADIGVAMGRTGTDVTREAADLVLADDNYATIVEAIQEGRSIYANIQRFIVFLFAANAGLVVTVLVGTVVGWPAILTPTQILWINLITNGMPALALGIETQASDPMKRPPRPAGTPLLATPQVWEIAGAGGWMGLVGLMAFWLPSMWPELAADELTLRRSLAFTVLALAPLFHAFNARSPKPLRKLDLFGNRPLLLATAAGLFLQLVAVYTPGLQLVFSTTALGPAEVLLALGMSATVLVAGQLVRELGWRSGDG
jgi:Ca2+-transporting ATPase